MYLHVALLSTFHSFQRFHSFQLVFLLVMEREKGYLHIQVGICCPRRVITLRATNFFDSFMITILLMLFELRNILGNAGTVLAVQGETWLLQRQQLGFSKAVTSCCFKTN